MNERHQRRLLVIWVGVLVVAGVIGYRLFVIQVRQHDFYRAQAETQHQRQISIPATRGGIVDRAGRDLAVSVETESLYAHPGRIDDPATAARLLSPVLGMSRRELRQQMQSGRTFVFLKRFMTPEMAAAVRELELPIGGNAPFGFLTESKRYYPKDETGVHVVGFATIDGDGVEGIEKQYDHALRGDPTVYMVQQDARYGRLRLKVRPPEKEPEDVVLTLDLVLQHVVERELERAIGETGARSASAVLMDPATGHVLALANHPTADPNRFGQSSMAGRINRAVVHYYEPGSTFKVVPLAAALDLGKVSPEQTFDCKNGLMTVGRRRIRDISPHGRLSLRGILAQSSNIGMVQVAQTMKPETLRESILDFGFGNTTGIELPGESPGSVRHESRWSSFTRDSLSFGQEIGVTVLQMTAALAAIANDGVWVAPRVVLGTRDRDGRLHPAAAAPTRRVIKSRTARQLRSMMESVIDEGTGSRAAVAGYRVAGKSGTSQKAVPGKGYSESEYMASFGGFAPASAPRLVGLIVLDSPRGDWIHGGQVAAPVFSRIMTEALRYVRAPQDTDLLPPRGSPDFLRHAAIPHLPRPATAEGHVPHLTGLSAREAVTLLASRGYGATLEGSGQVVGQWPAPGEALNSGEVCRVKLRRPAAAARERRP